MSRGPRAKGAPERDKKMNNGKDKKKKKKEEKKRENKIFQLPGRGAIFFSVVNICIELSLYAVAVRFLDFRFFLI